MLESSQLLTNDQLLNPRGCRQMIGPSQGLLTLEAKIQSLPAENRSQVEDFVDFLLTKLTDPIISDDIVWRQAAANLSESAFAAVWDNEDDAVYDEL
jgi:hypothetical protein